jgi:hypothetical protein
MISKSKMMSLAVTHFTGKATLQEICNAAIFIVKAKLPDKGRDMGQTR